MLTLYDIISVMKSNLQIKNRRNLLMVGKITRKELIHKGKANNVYATDSLDYLELESSDRISAGNGAKTDVISDKGIANNQISSVLFQYLEENGIPTHYVCEGSNSASKIVKRAEMIPLEVICRFRAAGSFVKRYGCEEGMVFDDPFVEFTYKRDNKEHPELSDPPIDRITILTIPEQTLIKHERELILIEYYTSRTGVLLRGFYEKLGVELVDFKLEFGRLESGQIILCDEISPDTCRLVDMKTGEKLDKDRFRQDMGDVSKGYEEILKRVTNKR